MILCRRPIRIFDVDLAGAAAVLGALLIGYFVVLVPAWSRMRDARALGQQRLAAEAAMRQGQERLASCEEDIARLERGIALRLAETPSLQRRAELLNEVVRLARACGLEMVQVLPQPPQIDGPRAIAETRFVGAGDMPGLVRFLDALAAARPEHSVHEIVITPAQSGDPGRCEISCTLRFHLLAGQGAEEEPQS